MKFKLLSILSIFLIVNACSSSNDETGGTLTGSVSVDGSSTVFPVTEAIAEEFGKVEPKVRVTVGISGTGGGFKKFCSGEIDINDASRHIKEKEIKVAQKNGIEYIELPVAYDGLSVVVNKKNDFIDYLTVDELNAIWKYGSTMKTWSDVRPNWPNQKIKLYGPGTDSGTFDYFKEAIIGKKNNIRSDFTKSEDDNVLVTGVAGSKYALGFFGYAYYAENKSKLKVVPIDGGNGAVSPTSKTINDGSYSPLSRPIFIYVNPEAAKRPEVDAFVTFYLENAASLAGEVGYIGMPDKVTDRVKSRYKNRQTGKWF
ncbi:MAG: phosphate ABC transporter substrate-binding protein [Candidatus Marinimicrobia bacterium]|nr:phosphate ABC transporter substrate-binding protein [Candidatus Neomarinimicrobiota bacterium]|tara:strand:- start:7907 stop:8845 length:939 start_codon:yes stop_codon:yes gene_type:complete